MNKWLPTSGAEYHSATMSGRPVLLYGTPRYGPTAERHAIGYFMTGHGWIEQSVERPFQPRAWRPLEQAPALKGTSHG